MNSYDSEYYSKKKTAFTTNKKIKSFNPFIPNSINKTITKFNNMDISIIAEDDKEYSKIINKIICPKCYRCPEILSDEYEGIVIIICDTCQINKTFKNEEFIKIFENNTICKNIICSNCNNNVYYNEKLFAKYCKECKKVICFNCQKNNYNECKTNKHILFPLSSLSSICEKHNMKFCAYDKSSKENYCNFCLSENIELYEKRNIVKFNNFENNNNIYFNSKNNPFEDLDNLYKTFNELIDKFKIIINDFYQQQKSNLIVQKILYDESFCYGNYCYNNINNRPNMQNNKNKYNIFIKEDINKTFKKKFRNMVDFIFSQKIKSEVSDICNKNMQIYEDFKNITNMLIPKIDKNNKDKIFIIDDNKIRIFNNKIFKEINYGISGYINIQTKEMIKFNNINHISELDLKKYNSTKYKDEMACFLLCEEEGGVLICVLNKSLNKIEYYLYLNEYNCKKSIQLNNGDILCLNNEYELLIYKKNILEYFLIDLFKTFDDYMNPIYLSTKKSKYQFNNEEIIYIDDLNNYSNGEFNEFPNYEKIYEKISVYNFIEKINENGEIILIFYGNYKEKYSGYKNKYYIFYYNISHNSNNNIVEEIKCYEKPNNFLLVDYNNIEVGYNYIKECKNGIGIFNIITKQIILCCEIDGNILNFNWNSNNHLILCFNKNEISLDDSKIRYYIQEIDMQKKIIVGCRNFYNSEECINNNLILLIDKENDNIFYVLPDKTNLSILK